MNRAFAFLLTLSLLFVVGCNTSANPSPQPNPTTVTPAIPEASSATPTPTVVFPTPDWPRLSQAVASSNPGDADQAVIEMTSWARDASGLRTELGAQADDIFALADKAQTAAVQELVRQVQAGSKPKGMPAPLPPRARLSVEPGEFEGMFTLLQVLVKAPYQMDPRSGNGDPITSSNEIDQAIGDNGRAHAKFTATVTGAQMDVQVEMTIRVEKGGKVYEEQANGKIKVNICPDPQGNVPLDITLQTKGDASGGGYGLNITDHVVGHVDDDAKLTSVDQDLQTELSITKGKNWLTGAPDTSFAQVNINYSTEGLASNEPNSVKATDPTWSIPRASLFVSKELVENAILTGMKMSGMAVLMVLKVAETKWQDGKCVAITVPEGEDEVVWKGSETPFTAIVRHKVEGNELAVPVIATLKSGKVSVTPSGTQVPARATFRYKAPEARDEGATVELVTRSRRGIGKLEIKFRTSEPFFSVDTPWMGSTIQLKGSICGLDKPFTLELAGVKPGANFPYTGKVEFKPKDTTSGTWMATGSYPVTGGGNTKDSGGSTYQIIGLDAGTPMIELNEFSQTGVISLPPQVAAFFHAPPQVVTHQWPGAQVPMIRLPEECVP